MDEEVTLEILEFLMPFVAAALLSSFALLIAFCMMDIHFDGFKLVEWADPYLLFVFVFCIGALAYFYRYLKVLLGYFTKEKFKQHILMLVILPIFLAMPLMRGAYRAKLAHHLELLRDQKSK